MPMIPTIAHVTATVDEILRKAGCTRTFPIYISKKMTRTLGYVKSDIFGIREMKISNLLLEYGTQEHILTTIKHECAHAILIIREPWARHQHDESFGRVCDELGCTDKSGVNHYNELDKAITKNAERYKVYCKHCGTLVMTRQNYSAKVDALLHSDRYRHTACGYSDFELRND